MAIQNPDARTTPNKVRDISGSQATDEVIYAFINTSHVTVEAILPSDHGYSNDVLEMMETWLSCHLLVAREPLTSTERVGSTYLSYVRNQNTLGLDATPFGQFLKIIDTGNWFQEAEKQKIIFEVLSEYDDPTYYAYYV